MSVLRRFGVTCLGMVACAFVCQSAIWAQEVLPSLRANPQRNTVWVGDDGMATMGLPTDRQGTATTAPQGAPTAPQRAPTVVPKTAPERHGRKPADMPATTVQDDRVIAVSDERPIATDHRAATLRALAEGFRASRPVASSPAPLTTVTQPTVPAVYSEGVNEEPVPVVLPLRQSSVEANVPARVSMPAPQAHRAATVEDAMPAMVEMLPPVAAESPSRATARFTSVEEAYPRQEPSQSRMTINPLRRAADAISRRNPLRSAE